MRSCVLLLVSVVCLGFAGLCSVHGRTWNSKAGTSIEAELLARDVNNVELQKPDGTVIKVPIAALSDADQEFIRTGGEVAAPQAAVPVAVPAPAVEGEAEAPKPALIEGELRKWTSQDGATIEARLAQQTISDAVLQNQQGEFLRVPIRNLSAADRMYLISQKYKEFEQHPKPPEGYEWPNGQVSGPVKCKKDDKWSYYLYLPKNFNLSRKWPVMFIMSPGGGNKNISKRYEQGADMNGWILAVSVESKNNFKDSGSAIVAMVNDVLERLPVDEDRLYSSGFSGGARMAFSLAKGYKKQFAGILPCGAGGLGVKLGPNTHIYGLIGSNCFNRWDMACTFKEYKPGQSILWFFPGKHVWAEAPLITEAMSWLNYKYLEGNVKRKRDLEAEWHRCVKGMLERINTLAEKDPEAAYRQAGWIDSGKVQPYFTAEVRDSQSRLEKADLVKRYKLAEVDMQKLVKKYFETDVMDYVNKNCPDGLVKDAAALAEKFKDLKLAQTILQMGGPAPQ